MADPAVLTKAELLAAMRQGWDELQAYLAALSPAQITQPADAAGWRVQDHVMHLAMWENSLNAFLQKQSRPASMGVDLDTWNSGDINKINDVIYQRNKSRSWADVQQIFRNIHEELIGRIEALTDEDLQRPYHYYQPDSEATDPAAKRIAFASFQHYARHRPWMETIARS